MPSPEQQASWELMTDAVAAACGVERAPREPRDDVDWERFAGLFARHGVGALVHAARRVDPPAKTADALREIRMWNALAILRLLRLQRQVLDALAGADVPAVVLKGAALGQEAFGNPALRESSDLDVLVEPERVEDAIAALEAAGLEWRGVDLPDDMRPPDGGRSALARAGDLPRINQALMDGSGFVVELHWRLTGNPHLLPFDPEWLRAPRQVEVGGVATPLLPVEPAWWYLLVHGTEHAWMRLKWVADVVGLATRDPSLLSVPRLEDSRRAGVERCVACGVLVAERTLGPFAPPEALAWAGSVRGAERLVNRSLAALKAGTAGGQVITPRSLPAHAAARMSLRGDARYRLAEVKGMLLEAGRMQLVPDPGLSALVAAPARWLARAARGQGEPESRKTVRPLDRSA